MSKRAVLYARVSGDDRKKEGRNLESQLEMCEKYALERGWTVIDKLAEDDKGAGGADFDLPMINRALDMAEAGQFDVLVVREIDRFARDVGKQFTLETELKRSGVSIEYVLHDFPDTPAGRFNKNIHASLAQFEKDQITLRMTRGRRTTVKKGNILVHGRPPYGFRIGKDNGRRTLDIYEPEARIVRLIFEW